LYAILGTHDQIRVKGIGDIHHHHGNGAAPAGPKLPRGLIGNPTELGNGNLYPTSSRFGNYVGGIQNIRDRSQRNPSQRGDIFHAD
jgi:hypothetical protein